MTYVYLAWVNWLQDGIPHRDLLGIYETPDAAFVPAETWLRNSVDVFSPDHPLVIAWNDAHTACTLTPSGTLTGQPFETFSAQVIDFAVQSAP